MSDDNNYVPAIAVDFDGTIVEHRWPEIGPLNPGAREVLVALRGAGFRIIIHSCRGNPPNGSAFDDPLKRGEMESFLREHGVPFDEVWAKAGKPHAMAYIDDLAVPCDGENWGEIKARLLDARRAYL